VLCQLGYVQTILRHPRTSENPQVTNQMISQHYIEYLDYVMSEQDLGLPALTGLEATVGYIRWYFSISHPYILRQQEDAHISGPSEQETVDEVVAEEHEDQQWLDFRTCLERVKDHSLLSLVVVSWWWEVWLGLVCMRF
jgi:hypothetical protein